MIDNKAMAEKSIAKPVVKTLPPIKSLFTESYQLLRRTIAPFLVFNIIVFVVTVVAVIMMFAGLFMLGFGALISGALTDNLPTFGASALLTITFFVVLIAILSSIAQIGSTIILYEGKTDAKPVDTIKRSAKYILPLIGAGIISFFIVIGGMFLFIVPGIIFSVLLTLSYYAVVAENKGPVAALKRSFYLTTANFSAFFLRVLALWGFLFLTNFVLGMILTGLAEASQAFEAMVIANIVHTVIQVLSSWFALAYTITLFKHLKNIYGEGEKSISIISIISAIGWILGIIFIFLLGTVLMTFIQEYQSGNLENQLSPEDREEFNKLFEEFDQEYNMEDVERFMEDVERRSDETSTRPADTTDTAI